MLGRQKVSCAPTGWLSSDRAIFSTKNLDTTIAVAIEHLEYGNSAITQEKTTAPLIKDFNWTNEIFVIIEPISR